MDQEALTGSGLRVERSQGILTLRLDRPKRQNALDEAMVRDLETALDAAATDAEVRAVVITGTGDAFCAGADVSRFEREHDARAFRHESHRLSSVVARIERLEKPVVAAVNGLAVGVGVQLALACDLRVGSEGARFLFREGRLGLVPTHGGTIRLVKLVGLAHARDLLLSSRDVGAQRAYEIGLLTEVVPPGRLFDAVAALLDDALRRAPQSYGLVKRLLLLAASADLETGLAAETIAQSLLVTTEDHAEGVRAMRERRHPEFTGR